MKNTLKALALSAVVVATLAGCFKMQVDLTLNENDTIDGSMLVAIQEGVGESLGASDDEVLDQLSSGLDGEEGVKAEPYSEGGYIGTKYTFENQPLDEFKSAGAGGDVSITRDGDNFVVAGNFDTEDPGTEVDPATMGATFTFSVTFPGEVSEHNGTLSNDGRTVTWDLLAADAPEELKAIGAASAGGGSSSLLLIVGIVVLLLIVAGVVAFLVLRGRKPAEVAAAPADSAAAAAPAVAFDAAPAADAAPVVDAAPVADGPVADAPVAEAAPAEAPESTEDGTPTAWSRV